MKLRRGTRGALLALLLGLLLTACTTQESEESLELQEEDNTVSTESPVSQMPYTHLMYTCQGLHDDTVSNLMGLKTTRQEGIFIFF